MATIKQVAEQARVSVATVSRVVNNSGYVSEELRARVEATMQALDYTPSALARGLRRRESHTIGVLLPDLSEPFFSTLASAMEKTLFASSYRALICSSEDDAIKEAAYADILLFQRVDGVILVPTGHSAESVSRLLQANIPMVLIDRDLPNLPLSRVLSDNFSGGYAGAQHLLALGHRRIALIGGPGFTRTTRLRIDGAEQAFRDAGTSLDRDLLVVATLPEFEGGYQTALRLMQQPNPPTAIFALTDVIAVGVLHAAAQLGLSLPADLSVVGFDDIPLAAYVIPELTTVAQPIYDMGRTAVEILMRRLVNPDQPLETILLDTRLIVRRSTAPPRDAA